MGRLHHARDHGQRRGLRVVGVCCAGLRLVAERRLPALFCALTRDPVHYLFLTKGRTHTAIALITLYAFFFLLLASSYLRTAVTLTTNPGYVPKGPKHAPTPAEKAQEQLDGSATDDEDETATSVFERTVSVPFPGDDGGHHLDRMASGASLTTVLRNGPPPSTCSTAPLTHPPAPAPDPTQGRSYNNMWIPPRPAAASLPSNLAAFLEKEIYVCESDGLPRYCRYCNCWKPDRSHHCSEIGRCVMRMDHFCPWVGGVVAESSFRYFYQVVVYGTLYCVFLIAAMAACIHNRTSAGDGLDPKWIAVIALSVSLPPPLKTVPH